MNQLKTDINKIKKILNADYDHERPDVIRSKKFGRAFATMIKHMFPDCEIIQSNCYCEASGFIKKPNGKIIYYSSEDYRWPIMGRTWTSSVLYRTAESEKDYHGGSNNFSDLEHFKENVEKLFEKDGVIPMEERFYAGLELEKDLKMCAIFDELQNNNDVIILGHGRNVLVNEMRYVNNYSLDRERTGKTHIGFNFHFITFYYKGRVWSVEPSTYYPFTDENYPGLINAIPHELIDGWRKKQIGYFQKFESIKDCDNITYHITQKDYNEVYAHNIPFNENRSNFENILKKSAGFRERSIYEAPHICYFVTKTKDRKVIRCSKLDREKDGIRLSFDVDIISKTITN